MDTTFSIRELLFTLLLKVGVAASIAALLARWGTFRRVLFTEERDADQKLKLMLFMTPPLILGVTLRLVRPYYSFADLALEGAFLMGLLGGRVVGPIGGAIITIPALMAHGGLGMPAAATARRIGGDYSPVDPRQGKSLEFWPVHFPKHSQSHHEPDQADQDVLGNVATSCLCRTRTWPRGAGSLHKAQMAVCHRSALELAAWCGDYRHANVRGCSAENLEQHKNRDEFGAAPATLVEGSHGRPLQPDQSSFSV